MICPKCLKDQPDTYFLPYKKGCRPCRTAALKRYRAANAEHAKEYQQQWAKSNPHKTRWVSIKRRWRQRGITPDLYFEIAIAQRCRCSICGRFPSKIAVEGKAKDLRHENLHVDHDHSMDESTPESIRGLLCANCNHGLGHFKDNPALLAAAIAHLSDPPARRVLTTERLQQERETYRLVWPAEAYRRGWTS